MPYYVRAFCTADQNPTVNEILEWANSNGCKLEIDPDFQVSDMNSQEWEQVGFIYKQGRNSILCEINRDDGTTDSLKYAEIEEFKELLEDIESENKETVLNHLEKTKFIIANQLPADNWDDDGYDANSIILDFFVQKYGGMIYADGEGFYEGNELIVEAE
jgi:hypothetical protein